MTVTRGCIKYPPSLTCTKQDPHCIGGLLTPGGGARRSIKYPGLGTCTKLIKHGSRPIYVGSNYFSFASSLARPPGVNNPSIIGEKSGGGVE